MGAPRFHVSVPLSTADVGREIALPDAAAHHALRVLRMSVGDALTLFTGAGGEFVVTLVRADKRSANVRIDAFFAVEREAPIEITLVQGVAATDAMDLVVRGAVELGVAAIQPVLTARSARLPTGERGDKRLTHWRQIAIAACEQCGRNRIPPIHDTIALPDWLAQRAARPGFVLAPESVTPIAAAAAPAPGADALIGPEGGFAADEIAAAVRSGLVATRMGSRILRTGTAALAVLAALNALWGDFR